ncbi:MAG: hypothetical protein KDE04_06730 [Anaerolineales bacterium]|nr:hypothetical protein [Anaerolineales bacterium]
MLPEVVTALVWLLVSLPVLLLLQRWIHRHLQGVALLLTGKVQLAVVVYALVLFPGVLLHELSHWLMATILFVRTGKVSLFPQLQKDGSIQLGAVEYYKTNRVGPIRESLIGAAPLIFGTIAVLLISLRVFNIEAFASAWQAGSLALMVEAGRGLWQTSDIFVWVYLFFAISNAMMPSASDRKAWPTFGLILAALLTLFYFIDFRDIILDSLSEWATLIFVNLALAFTLTIVADLLFILLIALFEWVVSSVRGQSVDYS